MAVMEERRPIGRIFSEEALITELLEEGIVIRLSRAFVRGARRWVELSSEDSGDEARQLRRLYRNFLSMARLWRE